MNVVIRYTIEQVALLAAKAVGNSLSISYLTIFSHYSDEYDRLLGIIKSWGEVSEANNGVKVKLRKSITAQNQNINELRIRKPDPYRMQVGCCDFVVVDYFTFKDSNLPNNPNLRLIKRPRYEMIEFFDPEFDVLAYIVSS